MDIAPFGIKKKKNTSLIGTNIRNGNCHTLKQTVNLETSMLLSRH